jgi:hypothetical protein
VAVWFEGNEFSVACACMRIGRACNGPATHCDTDQSRIVYLVRRLISIWYCKWFMLFMTLDMPDEGTRSVSLKMTTARSVRFFVTLGLGLV